MRWKISYSPHADGTDRRKLREMQERCTPAKCSPCFFFHYEGTGIWPVPFSYFSKAARDISCLFYLESLFRAGKTVYTIQLVLNHTRPKRVRPRPGKERTSP